MPVVPDRVAVAALAEVRGHVLVAKDRVHDLAPASPASSSSGSVHTSWCWTATSGIGRRPGTDGRTPDPGGDEDPLARIRPRSVTTPRTRPRWMSNPVTVTSPSNATPFVSAARAIAVTIRTALAIPSDGTKYPSRIAPGSTSGIRSRHLLRRELLGALDAVGPGEPRRRFNSSTGSGSWRSRCSPRRTSRARRPARGPVQLHAVLRQAAHRPGAVRLEDQPGRVRRRTAGLEQGALVEDQDVGHAQLGQTVCGGGPHDPGTDDHQLRAVSHGSAFRGMWSLDDRRRVPRGVAQAKAGVAFCTTAGRAGI